MTWDSGGNSKDCEQGRRGNIVEEEDECVDGEGEIHKARLGVVGGVEGSGRSVH
jgi:hypothetical protein